MKGWKNSGVFCDMKVLITIPYKKEGGIYTFCETIIPAFSNDVDVFRRGVKENRNNKILIIIEQIIDYFVFIKKLLINKYNLIFINTSLGKSTCIRDGLFVILSKLLKHKVMLFIHGFEEECLQNKLLTKGYFLSDRIVVLAEEFKIKLEYAGYKKNIVVSLNPVNQEIFDFASLESLEERKNRKPKNILFLSRIEEEKGIMIALKTFQILIQKYLDLHFLIAGTGTKLKDTKNYILNNKIKNVKFLGFVTGRDKMELLKKSDIFLFPTYKEGLPINVLEAIAAGLPIITRPVGGLKDFFKNGKMGFMIESLNPENFAHQIELLINSDNFSEICEYNYRYARQYFIPNMIAERLEKIIAELVN
jgi:glycosyltransferase involved in cell wall biosynthesis